MSIYKHQHTDRSENWILHLWARLRGIPCESYIVVPANPYFSKPTSGIAVADARCSKHKWHAGRHRDAVRNIGWAYGDDFGK